MVRDKNLNKNFLVGFIILLFVFLLTFLVVDGYITLKRDIAFYTAESVDMIGYRMNSLLYEIDFLPEQIDEKIIFLSRLDNLKQVLNLKEQNLKEIAIMHLENDFSEFLGVSDIYFQVGYIDENGDEIINIGKQGEKCETISKKDLKNRRDSDFFKKIINFNKGEVYISKAVFNTECGYIMESSTPVFDENGSKKGVIFLFYYVNHFIEETRRFQREGEKVFLIDNDGNYLVPSNKDKENNSIAEVKSNFYKDYPDISPEIFLDLSEKKLEFNDQIFVFQYITPALNNFEGGISKDYFWILVCISEKNEINKLINGLKKDYFYFVLFSGISIFAILILIFFLLYKKSSVKKTRHVEKNKIFQKNLIFSGVFIAILVFVLFLIGKRLSPGFFNLFPYLLCGGVSFLLLIYSLRLKKKIIENLIFYGAFLIFIQVFAEFFIMWRGNFFVNEFISFLLSIIKGVALLLLLFGFWRLEK